MVGDFNREMVRRIAATQRLPQRRAKDIADLRRWGALVITIVALANMSRPVLNAPHRHSSVAVISAEVLLGLSIILSLFGLPKDRMERGYVFVGAAFGVLALGMLVMGA